VIGSIVLAIATDLFSLEVRGRVMGMIQTAFAASQVMGIPIALYLSNRWNWHAPFLAMAALGIVATAALIWRVRPIDAHLKIRQDRSSWSHLLHTAQEPRHLMAFAALTMLTIGGYMLMPFASAFVVHNLHISLKSLPTVYSVTGLCAISVGPLVGKATDAYGKFRIFLIGTILSMVMVLLYTHLRPISLPLLIVITAAMFLGIFSRMIPFLAIVSSVPDETQRGAFNAVSASVQQLSGGMASIIAGHIVTRGADGTLQHMDTIGYIVVSASLVASTLLWRIQRSPVKQPASAPPLTPRPATLSLENQRP
jgi:predicted MFS family arabinose efflux permease